MCEMLSLSTNHVIQFSPEEKEKAKVLCRELNNKRLKKGKPVKDMDYWIEVYSKFTKPGGIIQLVAD